MDYQIILPQKCTCTYNLLLTGDEGFPGLQGTTGPRGRRGESINGMPGRKGDVGPNGLGGEVLCWQSCCTTS